MRLKLHNIIRQGFTTVSGDGQKRSSQCPYGGTLGLHFSVFFLSPFGSYSLVERFSGFSCFSRWLDWTGWPHRELWIQLTSPLRSASQIQPSLRDSAQVVSQMYATHQEFDWCPEQTAPKRPLIQWLSSGFMTWDLNKVFEWLSSAFIQPNSL